MWSVYNYSLIPKKEWPFGGGQVVYKSSLATFLVHLACGRHLLLLAISVCLCCLRTPSVSAACGRHLSLLLADAICLCCLRTPSVSAARGRHLSPLPAVTICIRCPRSPSVSAAHGRHLSLLLVGVVSKRLVWLVGVGGMYGS